MDLRKTIIPKSDQLNADDLIGQNKVIKITKVTGGDSEDQPVSIHFEGDNGKPYKPCKTMRRLLVQVWGYDSDNYVGRLMQLYRDEEVKWAGVAIGGIRISHLSHIDSPTEVLITVAKSKRRPVTIQPLKVESKLKKRIEKMDAACKALQEGKVTLDELKANYELTEAEVTAFEEVIKNK